MAGKLVTVARFEQGGRAHLARGTLGAAGIKAVVTDEEVVAMDWLLGGAVGWVKVQVLEEDADRAVGVLEEALGPDTGPVDEQALAAEAEAAPPEDAREAPPTPAAPDPVPGVPSESDDYARRAFLAAVFALLFPPLILYAIYLQYRAAGQSESVREHGQATFRIVLGVALMFSLLVALFVVGTIVVDFVKAVSDELNS